jgi:hypothetical protein
MERDQAIMSLSQSEKIKAGLIWVSQALELIQGLGEDERKGAERVAHALMNMIGYEIDLAKAVAAHEAWEDIRAHVDKAVVMVNSGIGEEAIVHISRALSGVTTIGHQSMSLLKEANLL